VCWAKSTKSSIRNAQHAPHFAAVGVAWVNPRDGTANRDWFLRTVGAETRVPVRYHPPPLPTTAAAVVSDEDSNCCCNNNAQQQQLDEKGRAADCETKLMTMRDYIKLLDAAATCSLGSNSKMSRQLVLRVVA
jgi:hypothetical protein